MARDNAGRGQIIVAVRLYIVDFNFFIASAIHLGTPSSDDCDDIDICARLSVRSADGALQTPLVRSS